MNAQGPELRRGPVDLWARRWGWAVIAAIVPLVYWPISSFTYGLVQGDTLDCWMPWRWFIAQAMQDGHFPLWDPYAQSGYPIYADLQGPAWYPPSIMLAGTVGHTLYTLQALFLGYVIIGGVGFMRLVRQRGTDARIALVIGLAYSLGGFFTAHQMHFYAVISGAWLPWLLAAQLRSMDRPAWRPAVEAAIFQALLLTGGNHTFTIIGTWLLFALIGVHVVRAWRKGQYTFIRRLLGHEALFAVLSVLMACGTFYAWWEVAPYLSRAEGMGYLAASKNPFTLHAAWSWFFPYAAGTDAAWLGTDPTMANGFFGVIILLLAVLALLRKRTAVENTFAAFGLVCLLASFGDALPVHHWLWAAVPGMDLFRFPSYFQWFTAAAALLLAAGTLADLPAMLARYPRGSKGVLGGFILLVLAVLARAWAMHGHEPAIGAGDDLYGKITGLWRWHRVLLVAPVTLLALAGLWWWLFSPRRRWGLLLLLVALEMGWATTFAQWNTALGNYLPAILQGRINEMPQGPVWPELRPMGQNTDGSATLKYIWRNVQDFEGRPSHDGFNSFWLKDAGRLADDHPGLFAAMKRQPLVYFSDSVVALDRYVPGDVDPARDSALVVLPEGTAPPAGLRHLRTDSLAVAGFDHDGIALETRTSHPVFALLQQAWYPGWRARIDGQPVPLVRANMACFGVLLPAGMHRLEFRFEKPVASWLLGWGLATLLGACLLLVFTDPAASVLGKAALALLVLATGWSLFAHRSKAGRLPGEMVGLMQRITSTDGRKFPVVVNTGRMAAFNGMPTDRMVAAVRAENRQQLPQVQAVCGHVGTGAFWWVDAGLPTAPDVRAWLLERHHVVNRFEMGLSVAVLLEPGAGRSDSVFYMDARTGGQWLGGSVPWTAAFRVPVADLLAVAPGSLVVQADYLPRGRCAPTVVIERRIGDRIVDYEAFPLATGDSIQEAVVVRNLREWRHRDGQLGVYLWNNGPDSLRVDRLRVSIAGKDLAIW